MSKYHAVDIIGDWYIMRDTTDNPDVIYDWFAGYDFMGSANWEPDFSFDYALADRAEAEQIVSDLEAAEEDA